jgi:hypothetical protein
MALKRQKHTGLLLDLYREIYGPAVTMANLNELAADLSRIAGRSQPWTGKFLHSLIKGYPGFTANGQLIEALNILAGPGAAPPPAVRFSSFPPTPAKNTIAKPAPHSAAGTGNETCGRRLDMGPGLRTPLGGSYGFIFFVGLRQPICPSSKPV